MDKFFKKNNLSKLNQEKIENMKRSVISMEIKTVIKNLPTTITTTEKLRSRWLYRWIVPKV